MQTDHTAPVLDMTADGRFVDPVRQGSPALNWPMLLGATVAGAAIIAMLSVVLLALVPFAIAGVAFALLTGRVRLAQLRARRF